MSEKDDKYMHEINKLEGERDSLRREVERWKEVDRLRSEDDKTSETEWRSLVYALVDAAGVTRGTSIPEDVAHTKAAIERLRVDVEKHRMPNGDYWKCPLCGQYLDSDGSCPEECGNVGDWLANYARAQEVVDAVSKMSHRRCHDCGHEDYYLLSVIPYCVCEKCASADTRLIKPSEAAEATREAHE